MDFICNATLNAFSAMMVIVLLFYSAHQNGIKSLQNKLFSLLLALTVFLLIVDSLARLDGYTNTIIPYINASSNFILFILSPVLPSIWLLFVQNFIYKPERISRNWILVLVLVFILHAVLIIISQFNGLIYYIDSENIYHRGPFYQLSGVFTITLILIAYILVLYNRKKIETMHFYPLLLFAIFPLINVVVQLFVYGISLALNGVALSSLIVFLFIQNQGLNIDYLTGIYNRKKLEIYLKKRVSLSTEEKTFSAIMIDIDNFKHINDTLGHAVGDVALHDTARLLKSCLRINDFIARYGGDEFCIITNDSDANKLEEIVNKIRESIKRYNKTSQNAFILELSMGYDVYDYKSHLSAEEFQNYIDKLMYANKPKKKNEDKD